MIFQQRLAEVAALLPMLHVRPGPTVVLVAGPLAPLMAAEALRWRDTTKVLTLAPLPPQINDKRVEVVKEAEPADVILLSPEQVPEPWMKALKPGGLIQTLTLNPGSFRHLREEVHALVGNSVPWRVHLPAPAFGVLAVMGSGKPASRPRKVPGGAAFLSEQFIPCLFTFSRDELPLVFGQNPDKMK